MIKIHSVLVNIFHDFYENLHAGLVGQLLEGYVLDLSACLFLSNEHGCTEFGKDERLNLLRGFDVGRRWMRHDGDRGKQGGRLGVYAFINSPVRL